MCFLDRKEGKDPLVVEYRNLVLRQRKSQSYFTGAIRRTGALCVRVAAVVVWGKIGDQLLSYVEVLDILGRATAFRYLSRQNSATCLAAVDRKCYCRGAFFLVVLVVVENNVNVGQFLQE
jgi:hypothetical protein